MLLRVKVTLTGNSSTCLTLSTYQLDNIFFSLTRIQGMLCSLHSIAPGHVYLIETIAFNPFNAEGEWEGESRQDSMDDNSRRGWIFLQRRFEERWSFWIYDLK